MDKIVIVSILMTFVGFVASAGSASTTDFEDALTHIDGKCMESVPVSTPCSKEMSAVETQLTANDVTTACTELDAYKACLSGACEQDAALDSFKTTMDSKCQSGSLSLTMSDLQTELPKIDGKCMTKSVLVPTPCSGEKSDVETPFKANDLPGACTNLPAYKTCLDGACVQDNDLDNFIATMETTCSNLLDNIKEAVTAVGSQCDLKNPSVDCSSDETPLTGATTENEACTKMLEYVACITVNCKSKTELTNAVDEKKKLCIGGPIKAILGEIPLANKACPNAPGGDCKNEENALTATAATTKADACTKMEVYTSCLNDKCTSNDDLETAIKAMKKPCNGGPRLLQVSGLTLLLVAIVKFL